MQQVLTASRHRSQVNRRRTSVVLSSRRRRVVTMAEAPEPAAPIR